MGNNGWCPFADYVVIPDDNWEPGNDGLEAVVMHIMDGGFQGSIDWMNQVGTSAKFCISKTGRIVQCVSIYDTGYTNGLLFRGGGWYTRRGGVDTRVHPTWPRLRPGWHVNRRTIGIEHEGKPGQPLTDAMRDATIRVLRWIADELGWVYAVNQNLIGHFNLDNVDRARCPGPAFDLEAFAAAANVRPDAEPQFYRVRYPYGANVREAKSVYAPVAIGGSLRLPLGATFAGEIVSGEAWGGDTRWVHLLDQRGFVHMSAVEAL